VLNRLSERDQAFLSDEFPWIEETVRRLKDVYEKKTKRKPARPRGKKLEKMIARPELA